MLKNVIFICTIFIERTRKIDPCNTITDVVMFDGASKVHIGGKLLKIYYLKISILRGVGLTAYLFFNDVSKILVANQIGTYHKAI